MGPIPDGELYSEIRETNPLRRVNRIYTIKGSDGKRYFGVWMRTAPEGAETPRDGEKPIFGEYTFFVGLLADGTTVIEYQPGAMMPPDMFKEPLSVSFSPNHAT